LRVDFSKLKYDPRERQKMIVAYPVMKGRFPSHKDVDMLIRFAIMFCDPFSPIAEERDLDNKKRDALEALGEKVFSDFYKHIADNDALWKDVMFSYFVLINHTQYETWLTLKESFHILAAELRGHIDSKDRGKISKDLSAINDEIVELEAKLFPDDYTKNQIVEKIPVGGYAERFAESLN